MEDDAGKLTHKGGATGRIQGADYSLWTTTACGVPLVEIVTSPDRGRARADAPEIGQDLRRRPCARSSRRSACPTPGWRKETCAATRTCRCVRAGRKVLGTRTETKNVNSLRSVERAVRYEIQRQAALLAAGGTITQETRHWHEDTGRTSAGRPKSDADDYRYFPEPDLVPVAPSREWVEELRATLPEPPAARRKRLQAAWGLANLEFQDVVNSDLLDAVEATVAAGAAPQSARKWWTGEVARLANAPAWRGTPSCSPARWPR